ncbi:peptidase C15 [Pseudanabaena sp. FACHB-2040]|uniref:pyroglutamyl-peptidase I family protein n=1 Tax=Pseudanabaena sp. FACHB-2040 TaxID=2692859 RepID=UPI001689AC15|nr:peptidase C15 [Pseudanabaena sp. FACHB-2040]MBD2260208.1 peptidase C15 [Pseudanabaena sp. FACHB-2040]
MSTILLTSFAPWKADQRSNSSDDLLVSLQQRQELPDNALLMRQVPVNFHLAPCHIIAKLVELRPAVLICCGMAEKRHCLSLELNGRYEDKTLKTALNLPELIAGTRLTEISHCAGTYVCNHLYFKVLEFIQRTRCSTQAIFIHVPPLNPLNQEFVAADFTLILQRLSLPATAPLPLVA